jgi:hypothetical protein
LVEDTEGVVVVLGEFGVTTEGLGEGIVLGDEEEESSSRDEKMTLVG